jgi:hypothetical protein
MIDSHRIDQQMIRLDSKPMNRGQHRHPRRLVDIHTVDRLCIDLGYAERQGNFTNSAIQPLTILAQQLLGIFESGVCKSAHLLGKNDRSRDDRTEERTTPYLIDSCDRTKAAVTQSLFRSIAADKLTQHTLLGRGRCNGSLNAKRSRGSHALKAKFTTFRAEESHGSKTVASVEIEDKT